MNDFSKTTIDVYNKTAPEYIAKVQKYAPEPEREKFMTLVKRGGKILDAGCGSGRDVNFFASQGYRVTGIDLSTELLAYAEEHAEENADFFSMDLRNITFSDGSFDGIWACASLLHLTHGEIGPVLERFHGLIVSGGAMMLLMKKGTGERLATSTTITTDTRFFAYYSEEELLTLVKGAGFTVTEQYTWDQNDRNPRRPHETWITTFARA